jgi:hypothetical protein
MNKPNQALRQLPAKVILKRDDLSFTSRDKDDFILNWDVPHDKNGCWHEGIEIGLQHFAEIAELANADECEAFCAMQFAVNFGNWRTGGWGIETGFAKGMAAAAIVGLRALKAGAVPYDHEAEFRKSLGLDEEAA